MACICDNFTLYHHGCKCGEIQRERGETPPVQPSDEVPNWLEGQNYELIIDAIDSFVNHVNAAYMVSRNTEYTELGADI